MTSSSSTRWAVVAVAVTLLVGLTGCADATYEEKQRYLEQVRQRGETAHVEFAQQGVKIDEDRCLKRSRAINTDSPDGINVIFNREIDRTFVAACVAGRQK